VERLGLILLVLAIATILAFVGEALMIDDRSPQPIQTLEGYAF
jgi:hypothetical protein